MAYNFPAGTAGPAWSRSIVVRRRAALLVRVGASGPEGESVAGLVWDGSDDDRKDAAHLAQRSAALMGDPVAVRALQIATARNDLKLLHESGAVESILSATERHKGRAVIAWRLAPRARP